MFVLLLYVQCCLPLFVPLLNVPCYFTPKPEKNQNIIITRDSNTLKIRKISNKRKIKTLQAY